MRIEQDGMIIEGTIEELRQIGVQFPEPAVCDCEECCVRPLEELQQETIVELEDRVLALEEELNALRMEYEEYIDETNEYIERLQQETEE